MLHYKKYETYEDYRQDQMGNILLRKASIRAKAERQYREFLGWFKKFVKYLDKEAVQQERLLNEARIVLENGQPARTVEVSDDDAKAWGMLQLLTSKPVLFVCNVAEDEASEGNALSARVAAMAAEQGAASVVISAKIEEEIRSSNGDDE